MEAMTQPTQAFVRRQILQALVWGSFMTLMLSFGQGFGALTSGAWTIALVVGFGLWGCSELLRHLALSQGWLSGSGYTLAGKTALAVLLLPALLQLVLYLLLTTGLRFGWLSLPGGVANYSAPATFLYWLNTVVPLALWAGLWVSVQSVRRLRQGELSRLRAEAARSALEFDALRARLNPHFIFNALNNLRALINEDTERARDLVTRLSNTLRHALDHGATREVSLGRELEVVDDYLEIEKVHYEHRLQIDRDIAPGALHAMLPPMLLQLLVENAIKHGIACTPGGGRLSLQARMESNRLHLSVENPGRLETNTRGHGVGLSYLRSRLAQGPGEGQFSLSQQGERVRATLDIPQ
jgi:glucose-6-phosphate-specific signal transduction histidine kinase